MMKYIKRVGSAIGTGARAFVVLVGIAGVSVAVANYAVTVGAGTNFGSVIVGGVHYAQQFICDLTTPSQCAVVDAAGKVGVKDSDVLAAVQAAIPAGANTIGAVNQAGSPWQVQSNSLNLATQASLASLISTMGSPFQAGGSIGNTTFAATQSGAWNITNISGTVTLPTGAATAAKQPALGTAGTASADVITTQSPSVDPCQTIVHSSTPISITTATTTRIVAPTSAKKTYICYLFLTSAAADNIGIVEGTGGTCGTGTAGVVGGTTAANGPNFAANGGMAMSAGGKTAVAFTAGTNVDLCLITSAPTPLAGTIKWVQAP